MPRRVAALALLLLIDGFAHAQDMPLAQILIEGEGWKKAEGRPQKPPSQAPRLPPTGSAIGGYSALTHQVLTMDQKVYWIYPPAVPLQPGPDYMAWHSFVPSVAVLDRGGTLFVGPREGRHIWIMPLERNTTKVGGQDVEVTRVAFPFCSLHVPVGKPMIGVTGLASDADGRIYAATEIGVQVFDPIGRLCGVMTPAAPGQPELMGFEGDQLTLWIGETKYTRKLNATGVK